MCRICGRVVKCIFDTMPSRIYQVPSRRAFSTIRRQHITLTRTSQSARLPTPSSTLSLSFASLSITSQAKLPQIAASSSVMSILPVVQSRSFSASAAVGAPRRTFSPSKRVQKRRSGFLARAKDPKGQLILKRRMAKGRKRLTW